MQGSNLRGHPKLVMRDRNEKSLLCFGCSMPVIPPVLPLHQVRSWWGGGPRRGLDIHIKYLHRRGADGIRTHIEDNHRHAPKGEDSPSFITSHLLHKTVRAVAAGTGIIWIVSYAAVAEILKTALHPLQ